MRDHPAENSVLGIKDAPWKKVEEYVWPIDCQLWNAMETYGNPFTSTTGHRYSSRASCTILRNVLRRPSCSQNPKIVQTSTWEKILQLHLLCARQHWSLDQFLFQSLPQLWLPADQIKLMVGWNKAKLMIPAIRLMFTLQVACSATMLQNQACNSLGFCGKLLSRSCRRPSPAVRSCSLERMEDLEGYRQAQAAEWQQARLKRNDLTISNLSFSKVSSFLFWRTCGCDGDKRQGSRWYEVVTS